MNNNATLEMASIHLDTDMNDSEKIQRIQFHSDLNNGRMPSALKQFPHWVNTTLSMDGGTPLHLVMSSNSRTVEQIDALLDLGADVNAKNRNGMTPLAVMMDSAQSLTGVERLIERGADVWGKDPENTQAWSHLHDCAEHQKNELALLLIRKGGSALLENQGPGGMRPLHTAAESLNFSSVQILVWSGADVNALTDEGLTPAQLAIEVEGKKNVERRVLLSLLAHGANPEHCGDYSHCSREMAAAGLGDFEQLRRLRTWREEASNPLTIDEIQKAIDFSRQLGVLESVTFLESWLAGAHMDLVLGESKAPKHKVQP
jgi:ankyrin repeat protein